MTLRPPSNASSLLFALPCLLWGACTWVSSPDIQSGIGQPCSQDSDCNAALCVKSERYPQAGICATSCGTTADCPTGAMCADSLCQIPLRVGIALTGNTDGIEGWTVSHVQGLDGAASKLPYVKVEKQFNAIPHQVLDSLLKLTERSDLLLGNTVDYIDDFGVAAARHPDKKFACIDDGISSKSYPNVAPYWINRVEAWYLAGRVAARAAKGNLLGVISAFINPETVADVNAFTLGARREKPGTQVIVGHVGFWVDNNTDVSFPYTHQGGDKRSATYYREEYLASLLADKGSAVIAHLTNTQRSVQQIERMNKLGLVGSTVYSMANDKQQGCLDATGTAVPTCLGSIYENWLPLYRDLFEQVHLGIFSPQKPLRYDVTIDTNTPTGVELNKAVLGLPAGSDGFSLLGMQAELARAPEGPRRRVFKGPYVINGQRDVDANGLPDPKDLQEVRTDELLTDAELARMCWYVEGVVEVDPSGNLVPAMVPGGLRKGSTKPNDMYEPTDAADLKKVVPKGLDYHCLLNLP